MVLQSIYGEQLEPRLVRAVEQIRGDYGVSVSVQEKNKNLLKFGQSDTVGTIASTASGYTIMTLAGTETSETYVNRNLITHFASTSGSDVTQMVVEGHTVGSDLSVSSITQTGGTATCTTGSSHSYTTGDWVFITGANEAGYNGIVQITVTGATTFTYTVDSGTSSPATGTITATNQNKTFVTQTVTLAGATKTALGTALARCTRVYNPEQNRAVNYVGKISVAQDVTFTSGDPAAAATQVHAIIPAGKNQTVKASTSLSSQDYWIVTSFRGSVLEKTSATADVELQVRKIGGVFRPVEDVTCSEAAPGIFEFNPYLIIPANADVRLQAWASASNTSVTGSIQGHLAIKV